ncbi:hypothetical protein ACQ4PT_013077 [Festuca glaucescens]
MMDFAGAVQWWDKWQLRILVLGSLFVQYALFVSAAVRRCALPPLLRLLIWLAYLGGDALAIYALATLFNRNQQGQQHDGSGLEVLWAPVLLIHLGGQHMMTAYSVEDNELWRRHAITVVSQVAVALYVFYKSWSGEKRLLQAAILLFVVGIIRSCQKPWDGWNGYIQDAASYKSFNSRRGQWALRHRGGLRWSLEMSFDRSVLLWHIATNLCFHHQSTTSHGEECAARSRVISNYMAYLLSTRPEMLMPGTRNNIFTVACDDVELMLGLIGELPLDERGIAQGILMGAQRPLVDGGNIIGALVPNACKLAEALMEMRDEGQRWKVVQGVWVEMLCYSAGRCRGYMHAKNMNEGPELLSHIWFLLSFMGMETFADWFQKLEPLGTREEKNEEEGSDDGEGRAAESRIYIPSRLI